MVAMGVWPTDGGDGSVASEARWRKMARLWSPSGVAAGVLQQMAPSLAGSNLTVAAGAAWIDGHFCELAALTVLPVTANGIAVIRFDPAANTADLVYHDAVTLPVQSPTGVFESVIATITASVLTDGRLLVDPQIPAPVAATLAALQLNVPNPKRGMKATVMSGSPAAPTQPRMLYDGTRWIPESPFLILGQLAGGSTSVPQYGTATLGNFNMPATAWDHPAVLHVSYNMSLTANADIQFKAWRGGVTVLKTTETLVVPSPANNTLVHWHVPVTVLAAGGGYAITCALLSPGSVTFWGDPNIDAAWAEVY